MRRLVVLQVLLLLAAVCSVRPSFAQSLELSNLVLDNQSGRIKVRFGVALADSSAVAEALKLGQVLALDCQARLSLRRDYLWNSQVGEARMASPLEIKDGSYEITAPGRGEHFRGRDLGLVMREAWSTLALDLGPWNGLEPGHGYSLELTITLRRLDVSSWLKGALFFINFDAVSPVTYRLDFSY